MKNTYKLLWVVALLGGLFTSTHAMYTLYTPGSITASIRWWDMVAIYFAQNDTALDKDLDMATFPSNLSVQKADIDWHMSLKRMYRVTRPNTVVLVNRRWRIVRRAAHITTLAQLNSFLRAWWVRTMITMNQMNQPMMDRPMMNQPMVSMVGWASMYSNKNIVENVVNAPNLTTLVAAVKAAWLVETLMSDGPFTVFGPDNNAFAKLPAGTVETLVKPENKATLQKILTYHVVAWRFLASDLNDGQVLTTVQWWKLTVKKSGWKVTLTDEKWWVSTIIVADVLQKNGVAHVIDTVLMPNL